MKTTAWIACLAFFMGLQACNHMDEKAWLNVHLTDNPLDAEEVNVELYQLQAQITQGPDKGWYDLNIDTAIYDLLELQDTSVTISQNVQVPSGNLRQLRLILGENNTIVTADTTYDMTVPSGQQSGIKVMLNEELSGAGTYDILLDFDAEKSVTQTGSGKYILKPVIFAEDFKGP